MAKINDLVLGTALRRDGVLCGFSLICGFSLTTLHCFCAENCMAGAGGPGRSIGQKIDFVKLTK
jgi:hypothetical protein